VRRIQRAGVALLAAAASATAAAAQTVEEAARDSYFKAVAEHFELPASEVSILSEWRLPPEEIPVVLFLAGRAGVSPEAVVALRTSGRGWAELARRYRLDATQFHVPIPGSAPAGALEGAYQSYRSLPADRWREITLDDADIVGLVNLRLLSETLHVAPAQVLATARGGSWVDLYARLMREGSGPERRT
jgi:hypothetical protein